MKCHLSFKRLYNSDGTEWTAKEENENGEEEMIRRSKSCSATASQRTRREGGGGEGRGERRSCRVVEVIVRIVGIESRDVVVDIAMGLRLIVNRGRHRRRGEGRSFLQTLIYISLVFFQMSPNACFKVNLVFRNQNVAQAKCK